MEVGSSEVNLKTILCVLNVKIKMSESENAKG